MELRELHLRGAIGAIRTALHEGREHIVVPVTALMQGVIHAVNAPTSEFVPLSTLSIAPQGWNGRPTVHGHPVRNGKQVSANDPDILAAHGFGQIFKSRLEGDRLLMEAWVDPIRAAAVGGDKFVARLQSGDPIEVSVGAYVTTEQREGDYQGKPYKAVWKEIVPDHLAFLPNGTGACSIEMGCGAHRAAEVYLVTAEGLELETSEDVSERMASNPEGINQYTGAGGAKAHAENATKHAQYISDKANNQKTASHQELSNAHANAATAHADAATAHFHAEKIAKTAVTKDYHHQIALSHRSRVDNHVHASGIYASIKTAEQPMANPTLRDRVKSLINAALYDTPSQAASEEAAELVGYQVMRSLFDQVKKSYTEASGMVDQLIADEIEDPTETPEDEQAETEIEMARLEAIQSHCMSMYSTLNAVMSQASKRLYPADSTRYMKAKMQDCTACKSTGSLNGNPCEACDGNGQMKTAAGARHSGGDMKIIQGVHDHAVDLGAKCARDYKITEAAVIEPELKAACSCEGESGMKSETIKSLIANPHSGFTAADEKMLEAADEKRLEEFQVKAIAVKATEDAKLAEVKAAEEKKAADLKAAADKATADAKAIEETRLAVAAAKPLSTEEFMKIAPPEIRSLYAREQARVTERKAELVASLKAAQDGFTEEDLTAMDLEVLEKVAKAAKIDEPVVANYAGRGVPRTAEVNDAFSNPADPWATALKTAQVN